MDECMTRLRQAIDERVGGTILMSKADVCAIGAALADESRGRVDSAPIGVSIRFGVGAWIVTTGTHDGEPAVFIDDAPGCGVVGESAPNVDADAVPRLRLLFHTKEQAKLVADALVNSHPASEVDDAKDAARYRWLRVKRNAHVALMPRGSWFPDPENLDTAIDDAITSKSEPTHGR